MQQQLRYYIDKNSDIEQVKIGVDIEFSNESSDTLLWLFISVDNALDEKVDLLQRQITTVLHENIAAYFVGFRRLEHWLELYFYAPSAKKFEPLVASIVQEAYHYEIGSYKDSAQTFYKDVLYPNTKEFLQIQNSEVIQQLQEAGDENVYEREVEHYLFFPTQSNAKRALDQLLLQQFTCKKEFIEEESELCYAFIVTKSHAVCYDVIDAVTGSIYDIARSEHGVYEGWSTTLIQKK